MEKYEVYGFYTNHISGRGFTERPPMMRYSSQLLRELHEDHKTNFSAR